MKLLTTEQLVDLLGRFKTKHGCVPLNFSCLELANLIEAECREHGYAGIEDAYRVLIERETL